jgi:hypothetical protein
MLGRALLVMTPLIDTRHSQRKRAFGGKDRPLEFDPAELEQTLPEQWQLPRRLHPLCKWLLDDLWTVFRLVRAARDVYRRKRQAWVHLHRLIGLVLVRLLRVWKQLCRCYTPWIALVSLRWALRKVWGTLFGSPVKLTKTAQSFLKLDALSIGQEWDMWMRLKQESEAGTEVPGPFVGMVETWLTGDLPPPYREQTDEERIAEARFWL